MSAPASTSQPKPLPTTTNPYLEQIAIYLQEERTYRFPYFTSAVAFDLGLAVRARHLSWSASSGPRGPLIISIATFSGAILFQCIAGGDPPDASDLNVWATAKRNVVRRFGHSSAFVECRMLASGRNPSDAGLVWPEYAAVGGAFPIYLRNAPAAPLGAISVAGLSHTEDHRLIVETLADFVPSLSPPQARVRSRPRSDPLHPVGADLRGHVSRQSNQEDTNRSPASSPQPSPASVSRPWTESEDLLAGENEEGSQSASSVGGGAEDTDRGHEGPAPW